MIAQRFKPVAWVLGVTIAATALYSVSLRVANERSRLEALERKIASTKRDVRQLQTELGARGSLRQLERWNGEALALVAPSAAQFLPSDAMLSKVDGSELKAAAFTPPPVMVASTVKKLGQEGAPPTDGVAPADVAVTQAERVAMLDEKLAAHGPAKEEKAKP